MNTQQNLTPTEANISNLISPEQLRRFYRQSIHVGTLLSCSVYAVVRLIFHDFPFVFIEETVLILQVLFTGWILAALCIGGLNILFFPAAKYIQLIRLCAAQLAMWYTGTKQSLSDNTMEHTRSSSSNRASVESPEFVFSQL